ncbi:MAG: penicillin-binding protein 1C [Acidobacteria bacterium]|nr:penicillin-binding protein 1C [Acidobacteriota bacterium]
MKRWPRRVLVLAGIAAIGMAFPAAAFLIRPSSVIPSFSSVKAQWKPSEAYLIDRNGELLDTVRVNYGVRRFEWTALDTVSPALVEAVVDGEDRRFWQHSGVDWAGIMGAIKDKALHGRSRGASTITMQLAAFIDAQVPGRRAGSIWKRKWAQIKAARALEANWSKKQILEAYLNLLGYRGELQGIEAASRILAGKAPSGLNLPESLLLAALLPAPNAARDRIVARACARAAAKRLAVSCEAIQTTAADLLSRAAEDVPVAQVAPHVARMLIKAPGERVKTTLDGRTQRLAQNVLRRHLSDLTKRNVRDGAVIVIDNVSGEVLAYVGSGGPNSSAGNVDGVKARRQAGSTLKPFLYELALERRYLTAASLLDDSPIHLDTVSGVYIPQDYDPDFKGLVSVRTALGSSLNIPAVRALVLVGVEAFRDRLYELGYGGITEAGDFYGYSLALGSAEVSLWEQAQAYRALARGGRWAPIRLQPGPDVPERKPMSETASFVISNILSDRAARAVTFGLDNLLNTPYWSAAKTGTSKDMRDNWCIGFSQQFTVAVWVGNFEGDSMHDVSGVTGAAPIWQEMMAAMHQGMPFRPPPVPDGVAVSAVEFSPPVEPPRKEWFIDRTGTERIVAVTAGSEITRISSPADGMVIAIDPDIPVRLQRVPFSAKGASPSMVLKLNGKEIGSAGRSQLWEPQAGTYWLSVEEADGSVLDQILFTVR